MSALIELAERCEKATGPDRELDAEIACHAPICQADYVLSASPANRRGMVTRHFDSGGHGTFVCDSYTASLDAAMTLVPEGWDWTAQTSFRKSKARANCDLTQEAPFKPEDWKVTTARAATPALALCAAALRARAAQ